MAKGNVTISIRQETQELLKGLKLHERESYDSVVHRLMSTDEQA